MARPAYALVSILLGSLVALLPAPSLAGKRTVLQTDYDDARAGAEASQAVAAEMGLLGDPALDAYVSGIGQKLLRGVPRRGFDYEFHVVDQEQPNAFALPGGYIFVSRGLLALANTEDELACVMGHEIVHAAKRHAAAKEGLASRGNPLAMGWVRAANLAAYGRDMEREADEGGQKLCAAAGYDPMGMSTFLHGLAQSERFVIGYSRRKSFFDTHPGSRERAAVNRMTAKQLRWKRDPSLGDTRASLLRHIDGLPVGQRPEVGIFVEDRFLHPDMDFQIRFPPGWMTQNTAQAVGAVAPPGDAMLILTADLPPGDPREVAETYAAKAKEESKARVKESQPVKIGRIDSWRMMLEGRMGRASVTSYITFVPYQKSTWRITGMSLSRSAKDYKGRTLATARTFRPLTEEEKRSIQSMRLRLVKAEPGETVEALGRRTGNAWDPGLTAISNGVFVDHTFEGGETVKVAQSEPYQPRK